MTTFIGSMTLTVERVTDHPNYPGPLVRIGLCNEEAGVRLSSDYTLEEAGAISREIHRAIVNLKEA